MVAAVAGRDQLQTATLAADRDGRMLALRVHLLQDCGAYLGLLTPSIAHLTVIMVPGAYDLEHVDITLDEVLHEHDADRRLPRRRPARGGAPRGAARRPRWPTSSALDPAEVRRLNFADGVPVHDRDRARLRLRRLRGGARQGARDGRLRGLRGAPRGGRRARQLPRHRALDLGRDLRPRAVGGDEGDRHRRRRLGVVDRAHAPDRLGRR